jgi:elongator complex protein 1
MWLLESAPHLVEDAVKYIIFLVDANTLFDIALGMYDFPLVLMIAQHAQKVANLISIVKKGRQDADGC